MRKQLFRNLFGHLDLDGGSSVSGSSGSARSASGSSRASGSSSERYGSEVRKGLVDEDERSSVSAGASASACPSGKSGRAVSTPPVYGFGAPSCVTHPVYAVGFPEETDGIPVDDFVSNHGLSEKPVCTLEMSGTPIFASDGEVQPILTVSVGETTVISLGFGTLSAMFTC